MSKGLGIIRKGNTIFPYLISEKEHGGKERASVVGVLIGYISASRTGKEMH